MGTTIPRYEDMSPSAKKIRDFYAITSDAPIYQKEFGFYVLEDWIQQGYLKPRDQVEDYDAYLRDVFGYDEPAVFDLFGLGWTSAGFFPEFEVKVLEDRGEHEVVQDSAGRSVLYFKGRRNGFMPEYLDHPVKDWKTWEENVKWRLDKNTPGRIESTKKTGGKRGFRREDRRSGCPADGGRIYVSAQPDGAGTVALYVL